MRPVCFLGDSLKCIRGFPDDARQDVGYQLDKVQRGDQPEDFKPMSGIGKGVEEIRVTEPSGAYRVVYVARRVEAVYVLHAFQKRKGPGGGSAMLKEHERPSPPELRFARVPSKEDSSNAEKGSGNCEATIREAEGRPNMSKPEMYASVWDALADTHEQAANLRSRAELMQKIAARVKQHGWTQAEAASHCGVTQPRGLTICSAAEYPGSHSTLW